MDSKDSSQGASDTLRRSAKRAAREYLATLTWPKDREPSSRHFREVGDGVCRIQMDYPQYEVLVRNRLCTLSAAYQCGSSFASCDFSTIVDQLESLAVDHTYRGCELAADGLQRYFQHKHCSVKPRITVKLIKRDQDGELFVAEAYRDPGPKLRSLTRLEEHSLFTQVLGHGQHEIRNNIPKAILKDNYSNSRINKTLVLRKQRHIEGVNNWSRQKARLFGQSGDEEAWLECWNGYNDGESYVAPVTGVNGTQYKSALVVPITIRKADLNAEVCELFAPSLTMRAESYRNTKLIYGFVCVDHPYFDYFSGRNDPYVAFVFADLISFYMLNRESVANTACYRWATETAQFIPTV